MSIHKLECKDEEKNSKFKTSFVYFMVKITMKAWLAKAGK